MYKNLKYALFLRFKSWETILGLSILFLSFIMCASSWGDKVRGFAKAGSAVHKKDLIPRLADQEYYGEKYTFDANFGKTGSFYFSMSIANIGIGDHKMHARGVLKIDGQKFYWNFKKDDDEWSHNKNKIHIKAGGATLSGTPNRLTFHVKHKGSELNLTFTPLAPTWKPHKGGLVFGKNLQTQYHLFPLSHVKGSFKHKGKQGKLKGKGWGTHTWSHLGPHEQNLWAAQFRGIDLGAGKTLYYRQLRTTKDYGRKKLSYIVLTDQDKVIFQGFGFKKDVKKFYVDRKHDNRYKVAHEFTITLPDVKDSTKILEASFSVTKTRLRRNPIANYAWPIRKIMEGFSKPMEYAYDVKYKASVKGGGIDFSTQGEKGRLEVYHFNK